MKVSFERPQEIRRETDQLPANYYNKLYLLFKRAQRQHLFVPIRAMQYLAIIDTDEIIFVDGQGPRTIEIAWQDFQPQARNDLRSPVSYQCIYYEEKDRQAEARLKGEFFKALELYERKQPLPQRQASLSPLKKH